MTPDASEAGQGFFGALDHRETMSGDGLAVAHARQADHPFLFSELLFL